MEFNFPATYIGRTIGCDFQLRFRPYAHLELQMKL